MKIAILNGTTIDSRESLHAALAEQLAFPAYYGRNLDALYDLLGESSESVCIILRNASALQEALGGYYTALCGMLTDLSTWQPSKALTPISRSLLMR